MIDDLKQIHQRDKEDVLGTVANEYRQSEVQVAWSRVPTEVAITNVVYASIGGSTVPALMVQAMSACSAPIEVAHGYDIPPYVGNNTLFIVCSFSGGDEEVIKMLTHAAARGAKVAVITGDGRLAQVADENEYLLAHIANLSHSRFVTIHVLKVIVTLLEVVKLSTLSQADIADVATFLARETESWLPTVPTSLNSAKQIAQECMGRSVVVYASSKLFPAACQWKDRVNESAKQIAWLGAPLESWHAELAGWSGQPEQKPYAVLELHSSLDDSRVQKQFEVSERLLSGMRPAPNVIRVRGETLLEQLLWSVVLADFVSAYLALLNGYDPASLVIVDKFKHAMGEYNDPMV
jgi:glucose/mannose-6-phosphate isomerase